MPRSKLNQEVLAALAHLDKTWASARDIANTLGKSPQGVGSTLTFLYRGGYVERKCHRERYERTDGKMSDMRPVSYYRITRTGLELLGLMKDEVV